MNRKFAVLFLLSLSFTMVLAGCQKPADQQSATDANSAASSETSKTAKKEAAPQPKPLVVPADTAITVVLDEAVGSKISSDGETFSATVREPVEVDGKVAIPKDARASGVVKEAKAAGRFKGGAVLALTLTNVTVEGKDYEIQTSSPTMASKGKGKRSTALIGGGAAAGAVIGALAGGGKGAAIGALAGGAAGTGGAAFTGNRDITLPAETALTFKLREPLEIRSK
jgi:hypothetical protein